MSPCPFPTTITITPLVFLGDLQNSLKNGILWALDSEKWIKIFKTDGCMNNFVVKCTYEQTKIDRQIDR